jgi:hypothetical protein
MPKLEPMPTHAFPKDLRNLPDVVASELYRYRAVERGLAHTFYMEYENSLRAKAATEGVVGSVKRGKNVAFCLADVVNFFAKAAAEGVVGNIAFLVLVKAIGALRKPKQEIMGRGLRFEAVVSRRTYNRRRRAHHPEKKASRALAPKLQEKLETQYRLIVKLTRTR